MYVDDFKMAGKRENLAPMWKALKEEGKLDLEDPVLVHENVYLGNAQVEINLPDADQWRNWSCHQTWTEIR